MHSQNSRRFQIFLLLLFFLLPSASLTGQENKRPFRKGLILLVSIDQMKTEYYDWYGKHWTGGLKRIFEEGVVYSNAMLDYSASETGPGHATLATGSFPKVHGIVGNEWIDRDSRKRVYCVGDSSAGKVADLGGGMSPRNLVVSALGDWLKASNASAKVVSLSVKDRAAILMGGKSPDQVYWYDSKSGRLVTSDYYSKQPAEWAKTFNASNWVFRNVPPVWNKMLDSSAYAGPDELPGERIWAGSTAFPKVFDLAKRSEQMTTSPWGDAMILDAGKAAIAAERLGMRDVPDMLALGLSCTDYVGHAYGPNSHEMQDHLARLDAALGAFLAEVESLVGKGNILLALSADHACQPLPEYTLNVEHKFARRLSFQREVYPKLEELSAALQAEWGIAETLATRTGFMNYEAVSQKGVSPETFEARFREGMLAIDGVADVFFRREFVAGIVPGRPFGQRFANNTYAPRIDDFQIRECEGCLVTSYPTGTSHGSCYNYDNAVPVVFWGQPFSTSRVGRAVRTVDVAPTLARKIGASYPATVSGTPLTEVLENVR